MKILFKLLINSLSVFIAAYLLPGVVLQDYLVALIAAVVLGVLNTFLKPILVILTLPVTILTLGLFALVINAFLIMVVSKIVPGFSVDSFLTALLFSIILSLLNWFLNSLTK
jgi:putative membrane protein